MLLNSVTNNCNGQSIACDSQQGGPTPLDFPPNPCHHTGMNNKGTNAMPITVTNDQGKKYISLVQDPAFISAIQGLQEYVYDMNADIDMAYDWICDQADCSSFVADQPAWDLFYDTWDATQNLDD